METKTLLIESLDARWEKYKTQLKACQSKFSEEAVHDLRVAVRRLLSLLILLRVVMRDPRIKKMRRALKDQLDNLDDLRDVQVMLADASENIHSVPVLQPFLEFLQKKEKKLLRKARKEIMSVKIAGLSRRIQKLGKTLASAELTDLEITLFSVVDEAYAVVNQRYELVDAGQPATIHRLRVAFKKFRYMIEIIHPILRNSPAEYLKRLHDYQTAMGDIQDMEVTLHELADFDELAPASHDPEPARRYYQVRHALALSHFIEDKGEVVTFWRSAPDQPFPQENRS
ncbi:MAG: CHAD domain-containing protein [Chloroflexi bacterium]|nr:CHAD domain-containing protein [Chloroflexota bacterium]